METITAMEDQRRQTPGAHSTLSVHGAKYSRLYRRDNHSSVVRLR